MVTVQRDKQVDYSKYKELFFIASQKDPRNVEAKVIDELKNLGFNVRVIDPGKNFAGSQGTGFVVTDRGHILTCAHILGDENQATIWLSHLRYEANVINKDKDLDLAILKLQDFQPTTISPVVFRDNKVYRMGEDAYTIGFPLSNVLGEGARITKGLVSATTGMKDNPDEIQISTEIQPGNSGGPLLDSQGMVFGVVQKTLNPWRTAVTTGALPQNVNFAIKSDVALEYVKRCDLSVYNSLRRNQKWSIEKAAESIVKVRSGIISEEVEKSEKLVVKVEYASIRDLYGFYRFRYFVISFYDLNSQDRLFAAGQARYDPMSTEFGVIENTLDQVRKQVKVSN
jgi:S1-C subfamily serine protease